MARPTQQEIDEFNARMEEPEDSDDDFEIEIFTPEGHGARVPYRKGRTYLQQHFGIDVDSLPKPDQQPGTSANASRTKQRNNSATNANTGTMDEESGNTSPTPTTSQRYFGRRNG